MNTKLLLTTLVWLATLIGGMSHAAQPESIQINKSPNDQRHYRTLILDNQLQVLLVSDSETDKSAASLSVHVGSLFDPMSQQGMAHYLEHMLFLGTDKYPGTDEYGEFMSANGGSSNAYTSRYITNYMFNVKNDAFDEGLDRFSDFFKSPKLYPEYSEKEKNAVNAEWSLQREQDFWGQFRLKCQLMGDHPANRFTIGNLETLGDKENSKLHPETVDFYNKYYSANIMKLVLLSNRPLAEMEAQARKHFSSIVNKKIATPWLDKPMPTIGAKRVYYKPTRDVKEIIIDFTIENNLDQFEYKPSDFISYLISSEMPGTPAYILKDMGLISSLVGSNYENLYGNYGTLQFTLSLTDKGMQQRDFIVATVMQYINLVKEQGVDEKYFKEIKTSLNNRFRFLEKTNEFSYVSELAHNMQLFPVQHVIDAPYYYKAFNKQAIEKTIRQLSPENLLVWYVSKDEKVDQTMRFFAGEYRTETISDEVLSSWSKKPEVALSLPQVNRLLPERFELFTEASEQGEKPRVVYDYEGISIWNLSSHAYAHQPRGQIRLMINNPSNLTDVSAEVMLKLWANMFNLQQSALATEAGIAGMNLSLTSSNGLSLTISGFTDKQDMLLRQAFDKLVVNVTDENFKQAVDRFVRGIKNSEKGYPFRQALGKLQDISVAGSYENAALISAAEKLTPDDLQKFMQKVLGHNEIRVFTFGNYSKDDIQVLAEQIEALLPEDRQVSTYTKTPYLLPEAGKTLVYRADVPVDDVALIDLYVHPEPGVRSKAVAGILINHYRRLAFDKLRTEEQLGYVASAISRPLDEYVSIGLLIQTPVKNLKDMQARFDAFNVTYAEKLDKLTAEEFETLKASQLTSLREKPKNLAEEVSPLLTDWVRERFEFNSQEQLINATEKVSLDDLKQFFKATVQNPQATRINVQLRGRKFASQPYASFANEVVIDDLANFHTKAKHQ